MQHHPRFKDFTKKVKLWRKHIHMKNYGAKSDKGTWLYTTHEYVLRDLDQFQEPYKGVSPKLVSEKTDEGGHRRIIGKSLQLRQSQAYPAGFGRALCKVYRLHEQQILKDAQTLRKAIAQDVMPNLFSKASCANAWPDAKLMEALRFVEEG